MRAAAKGWATEVTAMHFAAQPHGTKIILAGIGPGGADIAPDSFRPYAPIIAIAIHAGREIGLLVAAQSELRAAQPNAMIAAFDDDARSCENLLAQVPEVFCYGEAGTMHEMALAERDNVGLVLNNKGTILSRIPIPNFSDSRDFARELASAVLHAVPR